MPKQTQEIREEDILQEGRRIAQCFDMGEFQHKIRQIHLTYLMVNEEGGDTFASEMHYLNELLHAISKLNN